MTVHNADIAAVFTEIADLLEIENANPFRVRAYRNAARDEGVLVAISSDAHGVRDCDNLVYGVGQARRGWL
jgi:DNA polymerase/3'-5' exonuclease PolX